MLTIMNILGPVIFGIAVTGVLVFLKRVLRVPVPGWSIPMAAAASMVIAHVYNEYSWFSRFSAELPKDIVVVEKFTVKGWYEPWTYIVPRVNRFTAIDTKAIKLNPAHPGMVLGQVILVERYVPTARIMLMADCNASRTTDLQPGVKFGDDGLPVGALWVDQSPDNPVLKELCSIVDGKHDI